MSSPIAQLQEMEQKRETTSVWEEDLDKPLQGGETLAGVNLSRCQGVRGEEEATAVRQGGGICVCSGEKWKRGVM